MSSLTDNDESVFFMSDDLKARLNQGTLESQGKLISKSKSDTVFYECSIVFDDAVIECDLIGIKLSSGVERISVSMTENLASFIRRDRIQSISLYDRSASLVKDFEFDKNDYSVTIERDKDGLRYVVTLIFTYEKETF